MVVMVVRWLMLMLGRKGVSLMGIWGETEAGKRVRVC